MSSQKGNTERTRPQKYKNRTVFKNNLHDKSTKTKLINSLHVSDVCVRCKEIIEWKIKYKKYKPLSQPKKCVKCDQRTVKKAYHVMCFDCGKKFEVCTKCCQSKDIVQAPPDEREQIKLDNEMKALLQSLPERKRRTFLRYMEKKGNEDKEKDEKVTEDQQKEDLMSKLKDLKVKDDDDDDFDDFDDLDSDDLEEDDE